MELPDGITTWVPGTNLYECVRLALREYCGTYPQESVKWAHMIKTNKEGFHKKNGMSKDGTLRYKLEVPQKLNRILIRMTHSDWVHDNQIIDTIYKVAPGLDPTSKNKSFVSMGDIT